MTDAVRYADRGQRTWFITGCSAGLGRAMAEAVIPTGDRLVACARDTSTIADLEKLAPDRVRVLPLEIRDKASVAAAVRDGIAAFGDVDILVNNAGVGQLGAIEEMSDEDTERVIGTNVYGTLNVTRAFLPHFRARRGGHIITVSSGNGLAGGAGIGIYGASKNALEGIFESLAIEVESLGIRITLIEPGLFKSDFRPRNIGRATNRIDDYDTALAGWRTQINSPYPDEVPDPSDLAPAIVRMAALEDVPLRFPIGEDNWTRERDKLKQRLADHEREYALFHSDPDLLAKRSWHPNWPK